MIFSQVTIELAVTEKKPNGAEKQVIKPIDLPVKKERITQNRLDEFSMQGLKKVSRYSLNNIGEYEDAIFDYFTDEKGNTIVTELDDDKNWSHVSKDALMDILAEVDRDHWEVELEVLEAKPAR